jgi:hypothetical protein
MDSIEIQNRVNAISKAMLGKGLRKPSAAFRQECNKQPEVYLRWEDPTKPESSFNCDCYNFITEATPEEVLAKAEQYVRSLPPAEEARLKQFIGALANAIELGKENGIDVDFLNPLQKTMKKLSDNILTDQRAA